MSSFGRRAKEAFSIPITTFPESLHPLLKEIDGPDGNGSLETDELTEVFEMYAAAKKANEEGCIALKSLPQDLQKTLQVFDVDGDGTVGTAELARAAELYQDSKNMASDFTIQSSGSSATRAANRAHLDSTKFLFSSKYFSQAKVPEKYGSQEIQS